MVAAESMSPPIPTHHFASIHTCFATIYTLFLLRIYTLILLNIHTYFAKYTHYFTKYTHPFATDIHTLKLRLLISEENSDFLSVLLQSPSAVLLLRSSASILIYTVTQCCLVWICLSGRVLERLRSARNEGEDYEQG